MMMVGNITILYEVTCNEQEERSSRLITNQ